jgi:hypothetical protein
MLTKTLERSLMRCSFTVKNTGNILRPVAFSSKRKGTQGFSRGGLERIRLSLAVGIRCRLVSERFKMDSHVYTKENLFSEIGRNKPDVAIFDLDPHAAMDGIEASRRICNRFDVSVVTFESCL